jgi:isocitrate dehydrogenase (NAD+)
MIRASAMLLNHIGFADRGQRLEQALDICGRFEKRLVMTGRSDGAKSSGFADYILEVVQGKTLADRWAKYQSQLTKTTS